MVFTALADGTVDRLVDALAPTAYGFGGLTDPARASLPARLLMAEIVRGGCAFAMMRNAFVADAALSSPGTVLAAIRGELLAWRGATPRGRRRPLVVARPDRRHRRRAGRARVPR